MLCEVFYFFPHKRNDIIWSHLMCALNIRWGCKGSIQEFSTLLRAPGLPAPSPAFSGYTEKWDWVEPATFTTTTNTNSCSYGFTGWLAGNKTVHDSQAQASPATSGLQPPHLMRSTLCCLFMRRFLPQKPGWVPRSEVENRWAAPTWHLDTFNINFSNSCLIF